MVMRTMVNSSSEASPTLRFLATEPYEAGGGCFPTRRLFIEVANGRRKRQDRREALKDQRIKGV